MDTIKLSVTIKLPGRVMMTPQECGENPFNYDRNKLLLTIQQFDPKTKKCFFKTKPLEFKTRKSVPASQTLNMNDDAYEYMISSNCPDWFTWGVNKWKKLSNTERLEKHLERTCESLGGKSFTYTVFED